MCEALLKHFPYSNSGSPHDNPEKQVLIIPRLWKFCGRRSLTFLIFSPSSVRSVGPSSFCNLHFILWLSFSHIYTGKISTSPVPLRETQPAEQRLQTWMPTGTRQVMELTKHAANSRVWWGLGKLESQAGSKGHCPSSAPASTVMELERAQYCQIFW